MPTMIQKQRSTQDFYRGMLCIAQSMLLQVVRPSVCLSVCHTSIFYRSG